MPGHEELVAVLHELGAKPEVRHLPDPTVRIPPFATRDAAVQGTIRSFPTEQWAIWPLGEELIARLRGILESGFDDLFEETPDGYRPRWIDRGHEVLITWVPRHA